MQTFFVAIISTLVSSGAFSQEISKINPTTTENTYVNYPGEPEDSTFQNNPEFENIRAIAPKKQSTDKLEGAGKFFVLSGTITGVYFLGRTIVRSFTIGIKNSVGGVSGPH